MYKHLFGPVPSRRLGMSLGVDLVPHKVCSLNCIYCECGRTTLLTTERKEYVPTGKVKKELTDYLTDNPHPDWITFSGAGEPTLHSRMGEILDFIKERHPGMPVAVLTNGTLLSDKQVRDELQRADLVLPSLDAATEKTFHRINRPSPKLDFKAYITGMIAFAEEYPGKIWLEVFVVPGYNDTVEEIRQLREVITRIDPDSVQINTLDRPGTEPDLRAAGRAELERFIQLLGLENTEIIAARPERKKIRSYRKDTENAILETISRRPCTPQDLAEILGLHLNEVNKYLDVLSHENRITFSRQERGIFYRLSRTDG